MGPDGKRMPMGPGGPRMMLPPNHPIMMEMQALDHYLRGLFQQPPEPQNQAKVKPSKCKCLIEMCESAMCGERVRIIRKQSK